MGSDDRATNPRSDPSVAADRSDDDEVAAIVEALGLEPLPLEGGHWALAWRTGDLGSIYFLVRPGDFSALHRLTVTELWHHYAGASATMLLLGPDGTIERPVLGPDIGADQRPMVPVPAGVWMGARTDGCWSLLGTTMTPAYRDEFFTLGRRRDLLSRYPEAATDIEALTRTPGEEP